MKETTYFYVSIIEPETDRYVLAAGPFCAHDKAEAAVPAIRHIASKVDPRTSFCAFGTCSATFPSDKEPPVGKLNSQLLKFLRNGSIDN